MFKFFNYLLYLFITLSLFHSCDWTSTPEVNEQKVTGWAIDKTGDSVYLRYNDKGRLTSYSTYKNGVKNGIAKKYFKNGKVEFIINYKDGIKNGLTKWFYESGNIYRETVYLDGEEDGIQKKFYEDGKLIAEIPYKHGIVLPGLKEYTKAGKLKKIYPELVIKPINKLAFENKYILRFYLTDKPKSATYFRVFKNKNNLDEVHFEIEKKGGVADIEYDLIRGGYIMEKVIVRAEFKTTLSNTYVVEKEYNLAIDN